MHSKTTQAVRVLSLLTLLHAVLATAPIKASNGDGSAAAPPFSSLASLGFASAVGASISFAGLASLLGFQQMQNVVNNVQQNFFSPILEGSVQKLLPPYFWMTTPYIELNEERVSDLVLDPETERRVAGYIENLKRSALLKKPISKLMLYGPTGNGKTALAKRLIN